MDASEDLANPGFERGGLGPDESGAPQALAPAAASESPSREPLPEPRSPSSPITLDSILQLVAQRLDTDPAQLVVRGRHGNRGREVAILLAREFTTEPLHVLGRRFGGVAPSAICEVVRRAQQRLALEPAFVQLLESLRDELRRG
jgi:chromosomal replication initiation ATPase DnaA